jgi:hypothetical protein
MSRNINSQRADSRPRQSGGAAIRTRSTNQDYWRPDEQGKQADVRRNHPPSMARTIDDIVAPAITINIPAKKIRTVTR